MLHNVKKISLLILVSYSVFLISCRTVRQPSSVPEHLNYSDEDIVKNEIERIDAFLETEPVRALWRASLLGHEEVLERCFTKVQTLLETSIEEKNYLDAKKDYKSLLAVKPDWKLDGYSYSQV